MAGADWGVAQVRVGVVTAEVVRPSEVMRAPVIPPQERPPRVLQSRARPIVRELPMTNATSHPSRPRSM